MLLYIKYLILKCKNIIQSKFHNYMKMNIKDLKYINFYKKIHKLIIMKNNNK